MKRKVDALYLSVGKTGGIVSRFGLANAYIGAKRDPSDPKRIVFDHDEVVMIPPEEATIYQREYRKALQAGDVVARTKADYDAWTAGAEARASAVRAAEEGAAAEAKKKAAAERLERAAAERPQAPPKNEKKGS